MAKVDSNYDIKIKIVGEQIMRLIDADVLKEKLEKTADINNPKFSYDSMMIAK